MPTKKRKELVWPSIYQTILLHIYCCRTYNIFLWTRINTRKYTSIINGTVRTIKFTISRRYNGWYNPTYCEYHMQFSNFCLFCATNYLCTTLNRSLQSSIMHIIQNATLLKCCSAEANLTLQPLWSYSWLDYIEATVLQYEQHIYISCHGHCTGICLLARQTSLFKSVMLHFNSLGVYEYSNTGCITARMRDWNIFIRWWKEDHFRNCTCTTHSLLSSIRLLSCFLVILIIYSKSVPLTGVFFRPNWWNWHKENIIIIFILAHHDEEINGKKQG